MIIGKQERIAVDFFLMKVLILLKISFEKTEKNHAEFSSQNFMTPSLNNVQEYHAEEHEKFLVPINSTIDSTAWQCWLKGK